MDKQRAKILRGGHTALRVLIASEILPNFEFFGYTRLHAVEMCKIDLPALP